MIHKASIVVNTKCNNSCIWCYGKVTQKLDINMSERTFDVLLTFLKNEGCKDISFLGGEPTLHPLLPLFIKKAVKDNMTVVIVSNGSGYSENFFDSIENVKHAVMLNISIEGATAETHDKITKTQGSFNKLFDGIKLAKQRNFKIAAQMTLCNTNKHELKSVIKLLDNMGIMAILINFANFPLNVPYTKTDFLTISQFCEQIADVVNSIDYSMNVFVGPPLPFCQLSPQFIEMMNKQKVFLNNGCQLLTGETITIDAEGNILLCNHLTEVKTHNITNIKSEADFQDTLKDIDIQYRKPMQMYPMNRCNTCNKNEKCFGGCPIIWLN